MNKEHQTIKSSTHGTSLAFKMDPIFLLFTLLSASQISRAESNATIPVVMWHGMGDSCCNPFSLGRIKEIIEENMPPGAYVMSLKIGSNIFEEIEDGFSMNVNLQVDVACKQIANDTNLKNGYNAVGFSQGSQFLRAVAQRCPQPPMFNLISLGGQHQGVFGVPYCINPSHIWCEYFRKVLTYGAYWSWVQDSFVQAQYWHDPINEAKYIEKSIFLADINNERKMNYEYRKNLMQLKNLVLVMFEDDEMVVPKESAWFGYYTPGQDKNITKLEDSVLYQVDRLGLKHLNEEGRLHFISLPGNHLRITEEWFINEIIKKYFL